MAIEMKVALEVAQEEYERFAEAWDLDTDVDAMNEEDRKSYEALERLLLRNIQAGSLTVDEGGCLT